MTTKILCVDDELNVLEALSRSLRKNFRISIAQSGELGISMIENEGPFAVVVSDMRMPEMDGIEFLGRVQSMSPETVRIMLTGNADQQTAIRAVNDGNIFRFLNKPCPSDVLTSALTAGLEQYRLVNAEKTLLEQTLNKSVEVLVDILAIVNPTAFGRSTRVKKLAGEIAEGLGVVNTWEIEIAAMLSQVGCVTVPEEILQKIADGSPLSNKETGLYNQHPQVGHDLIARIPRLETVAIIVADQNRRLSEEPVHPAMSSEIDVSRIGARILKVVVDYDKIILSGSSPQSAMKELSERVGWYEPSVIAQLQNIIDDSSGVYQSLTIAVPDLKPGMILNGVLESKRGSVLLPTGQEITTSLILRLTNLVESGIISDMIRVYVRVTQLQPNADLPTN